MAEKFITDFLPIIGPPLDKISDNQFRFKGGRVPDVNQPGGTREAMGLYISSQVFSGGEISAKVIFSKTGGQQGADIVVFYNPQNSDCLNAGIPPDLTFLCVRAYESQKWNYLAQTGDHDTVIVPGKEFHLQVSLHGSDLTLYCNGVKALKSALPKQYPASQVGVFFISEHDVLFSEFSATPRKPKAFVISQFSSPYNEVYMEVIKAVCDSPGIDVEVVRADETVGPGLIIADVNKKIRDANFIIADISPVNANVFYELGFAHGIRKPAILIAERSTKLPFDVSPFRTLFYDNTIAGKPALEKGLAAAIKAVLGNPL